MARHSTKYVAAGLVLLGAAGLALGNDRIRCALGSLCDAPVSVIPPEAVRPLATSTPPAAAATTTNAATTVTAAPAVPKRVKAKAAPPAEATPPPKAATPAQTPAATSSAPVEEGPTRFSVSAVPLLVGGEVRGGETVPLSYLQIVNRGKYAARLTGFWVEQNGNAPTRTVIGLATVDDKGGSRGKTGGKEDSSPFEDGKAFAPTDALFLPGQMRLFSIMATMRSDISAYVGTELKIDVASLEARDVTFTGPFPIRGTTWTLSE